MLLPRFIVCPSQLLPTFPPAGLPGDCQAGVSVMVTPTSCPASLKSSSINPVTGLDAAELASLGNETAAASLLNASDPTVVLTDVQPKAQGSSAQSAAGGAVLLLAAVAAAAQMLMA